jgi:hypothetical protein
MGVCVLADGSATIGKIEYFEREGKGGTYREAYLAGGKRMD